MTTNRLLRKKTIKTIKQGLEIEMFRRFYALIYLTILLMLPLLTVYLLYFALTVGNLPMIVVSVAYVGLSIYIWLRKIEYSGTVLNTIKIEEAPLKITRLLSETNNRGLLINQLIIKTIAENKGISQTKLYRLLPIPEESRPTKENIRQYVLVLESEGIIKDVSSEVGEAKKRVYVLTKRGEWCINAIRRYFPTYYVLYMVRVIFKTRIHGKLRDFNLVENAPRDK
jgi:hypothetical protein